MNFLYFSPNFPTYGWKFCRYLKENGVNVLGIGDADYDSLEQGLKDALTEYYRVDNLQDYDQVYRAAACLIHHHGKIDRVQSNNEFWLITEAMLRTDFNIEGVKYPEIMDHKQKSRMKAFFKQAGVDCADYCLPKISPTAKRLRTNTAFPLLSNRTTASARATPTRCARNRKWPIFSHKNRTCPILWKRLSTAMSKRLTALPTATAKSFSAPARFITSL